MKKFLFILLCVVIASAVAAGVLYWRVWRVQEMRRTALPFSPQESSFTLQPPQQAIPGVVADFTGIVTRIPRGETEPAPVQRNDWLQEGERVTAAANSSLTLEFKGISQLDLSANSEVSISNTLASAFLIQQRQGTVNYTDIHPDHPVSVRVLQSLIELQDGRMQVELQQPRRRILVRLLNGTARVSTIDVENNTQVETVSGTQLVAIDDVQKTITVQE